MGADLLLSALKLPLFARRVTPVMQMAALDMPGSPIWWEMNRETSWFFIRVVLKDSDKKGRG
jgi:hypothetical protein